MIRIYCDGIFDLFHKGHKEHFKKIKELYNNVYLIVGIASDEHSTKYKRRPIFNEELRYKLVESCEYVDEILKDCPRMVPEELINKYNIDYVVHAFLNIEDEESQSLCYQVPKRLNKFLPIKYNAGISTTQIIEFLNKNNVDLTNTDDVLNKIESYV